MKLLTLSIERLAGVEPGFALAPEQLSGRVRVIHGPNAIGKSSIVRALKALLWREAPVRGHVEIAARFEIAGVEWTARRDGATTTWTRDGVACDAPPLPAYRHADQMLVGLEELGLGAEDDIAEHVQRELGGGYDVAAVEAAFRPAPQAGRTQSKALEAAEAALRQARDAQDDVVRDAATISELSDSIADARKRAEQAAVLERARDLIEARRGLAAAQQELDRFPPALDRWSGNEVEALAQVRDRHAALQKQRDDALRKALALDGEAREFGLAEPISTHAIDGIFERIESLQAADAVLRTAGDEHARAEARHGQASRVFGAGLDVERLASLDEGIDVELESLIRRSAAHAGTIEGIDGQLAALAATDAVVAPPPRSIAALEDWLSTPATSAGDARPRTFLVVLAALLVALAIGLAFVHPAYLSILVLALVALLGARAPDRSAGATRDDHAASYEKTAERPPSTWNEEAVRARLEELRERHARAGEERRREQRCKELAAKRAQLDEESAGHAAKRAALTARIGAAADAPDGALIGLARARQSLRDARRDLATSAAMHARATAEREAALEALNEALAPFVVAGVKDHTAAKVQARSLRERSENLRAAVSARDAQKEAARVAEASLEKCALEIATLFARVGLAPDQEHELRRRSETLEAWKKAVKVRDGFARDVDHLAREVPVELAESTPESISAELSSARAATTEVQDLSARRGAVEERLKAARAARSLESAASSVEACRDELRAAFADTQRRAFACALLADVRSTHENDSRPRLLREAETLLARFTHGRYSLRIAVVDGRRVLTARDASSAGRALALDQLSEGTRAQLILAARLAYLREIERGDPLPVVLDDALATTDPARKREVGAALLEVARAEGRQFLVLSTDGADVALLRPADAAPGDVEGTDLAAIRGSSAPVASREHVREPEVARVPDPAGRNASEYAEELARAGIPVRPIDARREIDELHLWWVLAHDLATLRRLLAMRIDRVGALENALRAGIGRLGEGERAATAPWIALAASVLEARRIGRGRAIDRDVLERAGVSDTFLPRMASLAEDCGGDAKAWLAAIESGDEERAKGYRSKSLEQNREFLLAEGYLDPRPVLDREQAWMRTLATLPADHGIDEHAVRARFELLWNALEG